VRVCLLREPVAAPRNRYPFRGRAAGGGPGRLSRSCCAHVNGARSAHRPHRPHRPHVPRTGTRGAAKCRLQRASSLRRHTPTQYAVLAAFQHAAARFLGAAISQLPGWNRTTSLSCDLGHPPSVFHREYGRRGRLFPFPLVPPQSKLSTPTTAATRTTATPAEVQRPGDKRAFTGNANTSGRLEAG
jgi:hypothetical protein